MRLAELRCSLRVRKNWLDLGREDSSGGRRCTRGAHPPKAGLVQVRRLGLLDDQSVGGGPCGDEGEQLKELIRSVETILLRLLQ